MIQRMERIKIYGAINIWLESHFNQFLCFFNASKYSFNNNDYEILNIIAQLLTFDLNAYDEEFSRCIGDNHVSEGMHHHAAGTYFFPPEPNVYLLSMKFQAIINVYPRVLIIAKLIFMLAMASLYVCMQD